MSTTQPGSPTQPRQERSKRTHQLLLDAALGLFREHGIEATGVTEIAAAAGVAPATIYRRFGDKEGLVRAACEHFTQQGLALLAEIRVAAEQKAGNGSFISMLADAIQAVVLFSHSNLRVLQSLYIRALEDDFHARQLVSLRAAVTDMLKQYFMTRVSEIRHPEPSLALDFALRQSVAMLSARLEGRKLEVVAENITDRVFHRELMRMQLGYLGIDFTPEAIDKALHSRGM